MKKPSLLAVILIALCTVFWSMVAISDVINKAYNDFVLLFVLHVICALLWITSFIVNLKRYRSSKKSDKFKVVED